MAESLTKTFDLLATTKSSNAVDVLVMALDSQQAAIRDRAVGALLQRGTVRCQTEVIRRLPSLSPAARKLVEDDEARLAATLRQCLLHGDQELRACALSIVVDTENFDQVPTLLQILDQRDDPFQQAASDALQDLVNRLYEHCHGGGVRRAGSRGHRKAPQARQAVLAALDAACNRFDSLVRPTVIVESILVLGDPDNFAVRKLLSQSAPPCRELAAELLVHSKHPGVMRLLMSSLDQNYPHTRAMEAIAARADAEFVCHLLRSFPKRLSESQQKNLRQLTRIAWLSDERLPLAAIPPALHPALVAFVQASGLDADVKTDVHKWILRNGGVEGRQAAGGVLESVAPDAVRSILFGSLNSASEDVQAWATSQLRTQGVPEAIKLLLQRLDSSLPAVREAARGELESFNLELLLSIFDHLDRNVCLRAGQLVRKTDTRCIEKLQAELNSPIRRRRIRAALASSALGLAGEAQSGLLAMLSDQDAQVRRVAVEVLASVPAAEVVAALSELQHDSSPRVRDAAMQSLEAIQRTFGLGMSSLTERAPARPVESRTDDAAV
jgi:HEAT repeat protein